ncbi:MAG: type II toxin-antitoxin system Phd/YefM family antitoxin [Spirochaetales bacterium]|nr:type II toxin-antitoxin system Phd/YefM family antitoxin [Spirochaetales bacterium]
MIVSAMEARKRFGELLNRVLLTDEEIIIERAGKKVAKLTRIDTPESRSKKTGKLDFRKAEGLGAELWNKINVEDYIKKEREGRKPLNLHPPQNLHSLFFHIRGFFTQGSRLFKVSVFAGDSCFPD